MADSEGQGPPAVPLGDDPDRGDLEFDRVSPDLRGELGGAGHGPPSDPDLAVADCVHDEPFVVNGLGAAKGLHPLEHVAWALQLSNPLVVESVVLESDLEAAVQWATSASAQEVDQYRRAGLRQILAVAAELEREREAWARRAPPEQRLLVGRLHGPLFL